VKILSEEEEEEAEEEAPSGSGECHFGLEVLNLRFNVEVCGRRLKLGVSERLGCMQLGNKSLRFGKLWEKVIKGRRAEVTRPLKLKLSEGHHLRGCMVREDGTSRGLFEVWEGRRSAGVSRLLRL
jgi:hypothetical protein